MAARISSENITSFCGDVVPLHIGFDGADHPELSRADVVWHTDSDAVRIRDFRGEDRMCFHHGVLLELCAVGTATVTATYGGHVFSCTVTVTERKTCTSEEATEYYAGDLHDHTSVIHDHDDFADRDCEFQHEYLDCIKKENLLDFAVISDHADTINDTDFFRGFTEERKAQPMDVIVFPGSESEVTFCELDRFGVSHNNGGEIVMLNTAGFIRANSFEEFESQFQESPMPVGIFAHPQIVGCAIPGIWNFAYDKNNTPEMLRIMRGIEMGDGSDRQQNFIHEYVYSAALDSGFRVSTTCSSDAHGNPVGEDALRWGYRRFPGKTVLMAKEKSKEAFLDALRSNRFYGTESGNLKIRYSVNGKVAPADLALTDTYCFAVSLSYFHDDPSTHPVECRVISDGGETLLTLTDIDFSDFTFEISSNTAHYFYLRFVDEKGRRTWSCPVWTGRTFEKAAAAAPIPMDMQGFTAIDLVSGKDASLLLDGDPLHCWEGGNNTASILIDMQSAREIGGIGLTHRAIERTPGWDGDTSALPLLASLPTRFAVATSLDGKSFDSCAAGVGRVFGEEEIVSFEKRVARYVRFDVLSTVGKDLERRGFEAQPCAIGLLSLFS